MHLHFIAANKNYCKIFYLMLYCMQIKKTLIPSPIGKKGGAKSVLPNFKDG